jgi:NADH-quinone oxidoreductase subunit C
MPDAPGLELIRGEIEQDHHGAVLDTSFDRDQPALVVDPAQILAVLAWLREAPGQGYGFLSSLHAADYLPASPRFAVHYELLNRDRVERLRVKATLRDPSAAGPVVEEGVSGRALGFSPGDGGGRPRMPVGRETGRRARPDTPSPTPPADAATKLPEIDSCVELFPTAEFQEREVYDFFGIVFKGHPDLTRILMPEDYVGWPLRRDFPVGGEPVTFTYNERAYG